MQLNSLATLSKIVLNWKRIQKIEKKETDNRMIS